jgi:hypothetical protein
MGQGLPGAGVQPLAVGQVIDSGLALCRGRLQPSSPAVTGPGLLR